VPKRARGVFKRSALAPRQRPFRAPCESPKRVWPSWAALARAARPPKCVRNPSAKGGALHPFERRESRCLGGQPFPVLRSGGDSKNGRLTCRARPQEKCHWPKSHVRYRHCPRTGFATGLCLRRAYVRPPTGGCGIQVAPLDGMRWWKKMLHQVGGTGVTRAAAGLVVYESFPDKRRAFQRRSDCSCGALVVGAIDALRGRP